MREIKLRAFNKITKKMFQVNDIDGLMQNTHVCCKHGDACEEMRGIDGFLDEVELMQYTGLKDKNGKEIWEGDIVLKPSGASMQIDPKELGIEGNKYRVYESIPPKRYAVYGHGFAFMLGLPGKKDYCGIINYGGDRMAWELEVIGNIYENPDLLKEQS